MARAATPPAFSSLHLPSFGAALFWATVASLGLAAAFLAAAIYIP